MKSIVEKIFYGNLRPNDDINKYAEKEVQRWVFNSYADMIGR